MSNVSLLYVKIFRKEDGRVKVLINCSWATYNELVTKFGSAKEWAKRVLGRVDEIEINI